MATRKRLGIYWGEDGLTLVETAQEAVLASAFVPFEMLDPSENAKMAGVSSDLKILDSLQKAIRNKGFSTFNTHVALPSKDILIRSFVIPWMKSSEIHDSVAFEAKKYIPFGIEETAYTYYPATTTQNGIRQIVIIFVAIRKSVLSRYTNILIQSGLNIIYSEPAAMSLVRGLVHRRLIDENQNTAILNVSGNTGELIIVLKGYIKFYRDFKINTDNADMLSGNTDDFLRTRMFNEIRISLEFFSRQYAESEVDKLIIISAGRPHSFWTGLQDEITAPLEIIDSSRVFHAAGIADIAGAAAAGATMSGDIASVIDFNLFEEASTQVSLKREEILKKNKQLILPVISGIGAAFLISIVFYFSGIVLDGWRTQVKTITARVGSAASMALQDIENQTDDIRNKLQAFKSIPSGSRTSLLLIRLVKRMPMEMTLDSFKLGIDDQDARGVGAQQNTTGIKYAPIRSKFTLNIDATLHLEDANKAFDTANRFINRLRKDDLFASRFQRVVLTSLKSQVDGKKKAAVLKITCEGK